MTEEEQKSFDNSPLTGRIQRADDCRLERAVMDNVPFPTVTPVPADVELADHLKERLVIVDGHIDDLNNAIKDMVARLQEYERSGDILRAALNAAKADPKFVDGE